LAPQQSYEETVRAAAAGAAPQQQPPLPAAAPPQEDGDVDATMEDAGAPEAPMTPDRAELIKKLTALDSLLAKLSPLQADDADVMALADEKRLEKQAVQAALRAGRPTRTLLKTATDQHDKAKKRQARAAEEERGLRVLLERAQSQRREAADAVALHLDEITALERKLREEDMQAPQPPPTVQGALPPNVTQDQWNLFMAWMIEQQHAATQQQAAMQQPGAQPQACTPPTQPVRHTPPPTAPATPQQVTPGQPTPVAAPATSLLDLAEDLAHVSAGPFRARRDSRSRSQQEPYQPEKPLAKKTSASPMPAQPAPVEEYQFGGISSDDEDE